LREVNSQQERTSMSNTMEQDDFMCALTALMASLSLDDLEGDVCDWCGRVTRDLIGGHPYALCQDCNWKRYTLND
jgi:hypothetical protein